MVNGPRHYFVTGFPGFIAKRLVREILTHDAQAHLALLVQPHLAAAARRAIPDGDFHRCDVFMGDVADLHFGLLGRDWKALVARTHAIFHLAATQSLSAPRPVAFRVNVEGTRQVLELATEAPNLVRLNHFSSCLVSGKRTGVIPEGPVSGVPEFHNAYEESKFIAERLVRATMPRLGVTVYRPGTVVGDSRTGEVERFDGPYYQPLLASLAKAASRQVAQAGWNVVPVDYVVKAAWTISTQPRSRGKTVHLVDPNPGAAPNQTFGTDGVRERLRALVGQARRSAGAGSSSSALYSCRETLSLLEGTDVHCPPLESYWQKLVDFAAQHLERERARLEDPLDVGPALG